MREIIFQAPDYASILADAERLGFVSEDADGEKRIITNGTFESGGGWFINLVGDVYEPIVGPIDTDNPPTPVKRPGYFGRLRINGEPTDFPTFSTDIVQYVWSEDLGGWTSDGVTLAPEWVGNIGVIA